MGNHLKNAFVTTFIAVILLGPIMGFVLNGFSIEFYAHRVLILALIVFICKLAFLLIQNQTFGKKILQKFKPHNHHIVRVRAISQHIGFKIFLFCFGSLLPFILSKYWLTVAILCLIYVLLGLGLNIVVGLAGLLNLGYVAFYAVGAYSYALGATYLHLGFWSALPFSALLAGLFGILLAFPVLKMYGDYLAIVTLGFAEIVRLILTNWSNFTGGPNGLSTPPLTLFGLEFTRVANQGKISFHKFFHIPYDINHRNIALFLVLFLTVCIVIHLITRLQRMPLGRAWEALREDEIASRSLGINHVVTKVSAFYLGAMIGGIGGVFFAAFQGFVNPTSFTFTESALILAIVVLGGMGSTLGVILAAIILTLLPELLREFSEYRMLVFGASMVLMMIWRPVGLVKIQRPWIADPRKNDNE